MNRIAFNPDKVPAMKHLLILILTLACSSTIFAQEGRSRRIPHPAPGKSDVRTPPIPGRAVPSIRADIPRPFAPQPPAKTPIKRNITIQVGGNFQGFVPMDLALTGTGPTFRTDLITRSSESDIPPTVITFEAHIDDQGKSYQVEYSLGARIAVKTGAVQRQGGSTSYNIEYRDIVLTGTVALTPGEPVVLSKLNGKELTLVAAPAKTDRKKRKDPARHKDSTRKPTPPRR
jgi:hypothetical protein